jgi:UDP-glucose 4-epimerase
MPTASSLRHVLITGGAGFIGSHLVEAFLERGDRVTILDDLSTGRLGNVAQLEGHDGFRMVIDTVANEGVLDGLVSSCDLIVHLAAAVGVELIVRTRPRLGARPV